MLTADDRYRLSQELGIPPYMWIPPKKRADLTPTQNTRSGIVDPDGKWVEALNAAYERVYKPDNFEEKPGMDQGPITKNPHPLSDFTHSHVQELHLNKDPDFNRIRASLKPGTDQDVENDVNNLEKMTNQVGPRSAPFRRLQLAFDLIMLKAYDLFKRMNNVLAGVSDPQHPEDTYEKLRDEYIAFLRNLDDHDPEHKPGQVDPRRCFGYGKVIKWVYIDPILQNLKLNGQDRIQITGATLVLEWNPHSSSSGIPVQHPVNI